MALELGLFQSLESDAYQVERTDAEKETELFMSAMEGIDLDDPNARDKVEVATVKMHRLLYNILDLVTIFHNVSKHTWHFLVCLCQSIFFLRGWSERLRTPRLLPATVFWQFLKS